MKAHFCLGTHWDREWYKPFQEFRMWLVELIDETMDLMDADPDFGCFHLDGQTVVLEDYFEIRPEQKERLLSFIKAGKILIGPWYNLPDEWLISGESFIRNLKRGIDDCAKLGVPHLDFAYTPDQFGHVAALPMIMNGFGLSAGICWRGAQDEEYPTQFVWVGPDGSRMVYHKLSDVGSYGPFDLRFRTHVKKEGMNEEVYKKYFDPYFNTECDRAPLPHVLLLDAIDHQRPDPQLPKLLDALRERHPEVEFEWTNLAEYGRTIAAAAGELEERRGELRQPCRDSERYGHYLIVHTISSRYDLKQRNDYCQSLLEQWVEPYLLYQQLAGGKPLMAYLDKAWEYLLKNHPHDSICGCSVDQVHRDMHYRFDQCDMIGDGLRRRAMAHLAQASAEEESWKNVVVHNPLPWARKGIYEIAIPFPKDYGEKSGYIYHDGLATSERYNKFHLVDAQAKRIPYQHRCVEHNGMGYLLTENGREKAFPADVYHVAIEVELPAGGFMGLQVEGTNDATRNFGSLCTDTLSAENGRIRCAVGADGAVSLTHLESGRSFENLFCYEDAADCGDGWTHGKPLNDCVYRGHGASVMTALEEDGPLRTVFRIERRFELPSQLDRRTWWRADARRELRVIDQVMLEKDAPYLRVRSTVENTLEDHRLRVLFPTHIDAEHSFAETPFALVDREIMTPPESALWQERVNTEKAFSGYFGLQDETGGLAVLAPFGLHEYAVTESAEHSLALTLFRSFFQTVETAGEPDGQLLGPLSFEYLLFPFAKAFDPVQAATILMESRACPVSHSAKACLQAESFASVEGSDVVLSALKPAADGQGAIVRCWNPDQEKAGEATVTLKRPITSAARCDLKEAVQESLAVDKDGRLRFSVPAGGLATIHLAWD